MAGKEIDGKISANLKSVRVCSATGAGHCLVLASAKIRCTLSMGAGFPFLVLAWPVAGQTVFFARNPDFSPFS